MSSAKTKYLKTTLEIHVRCRNLRKKDMLSQSDPFAVLTRCFQPTDSNEQLPTRLPSIANETEIGRTEVLRDSSNPEFVSPFRADFVFEEEQQFCVRVYDEDAQNNPDLKKHDYLGGMHFTLGQLMGAKGNSLAKPLGRGNAYIVLQGEQVLTDDSEFLEFQLSGKGLKNMDGIFGKSDPYYVFKRINPDNMTWSTVHKSDVIMNDLNPVWHTERVSLSRLCNGDKNRHLQIHLLDWDRNGSHDDMGFVETTIEQMLTCPISWQVMKESKRKKGKSTPCGTLTCNKAELIKTATLLEYVSGGCEISLMMAIDFTVSNGDPGTPKSLHYRKAGTRNAYQSAISRVGTIIQEYDSDKCFSMYGFGAKIGPNRQLCFQMGLEEEVRGPKGMLDAYNQTFEIPGFGLSGPTNFEPILKEAMKCAFENSSHKQCYSILVILTDGVITDFVQTVDMIYQIAEKAPLSIIICGIGQANFDKMELLDGDSGDLKNSKGQPLARDVVQFVPLRKFSGNIDKLAAETLREIPHQLTQYYLKRGIYPSPPIPKPAFAEEDVFAQGK